MLEIIFHQVFWVILSFFLFFFLMNKFVITNVKEIQARRADYNQKLLDQINAMENKSIVLKNVANNILFEEIPNKQKNYLKSKLEPVINELYLLELNEKQVLKEKLSRHRPHHFNQEILSHKEIQAKLEELSNILMKKSEK